MIGTALPLGGTRRVAAEGARFVRRSIGWHEVLSFATWFSSTSTRANGVMAMVGRTGRKPVAFAHCTFDSCRSDQLLELGRGPESSSRLSWPAPVR